MANPFREMSPSRVRVGLQADRQAIAIRELASTVASDPDVTDYGGFLSCLFQKGVPGGNAARNRLAILHRCDGSVAQAVLLLGVSRSGVAWDGGVGPVHAMLVSVCPERHEEPHLRNVAEAARMLHQPDCLEELLTCSTPSEALGLLGGERPLFRRAY